MRIAVSNYTLIGILCFVALPVFGEGLFGQQIDPVEKAYQQLSFRELGPFRGGRSAAATGVPGNPMLYYFGAAGGGVWKTDDGGANWSNISDGSFGGSIGAIAVAKSDSNVIYVGGGECTVRGNVSHGDGVWKSLDAGKTWKHCGLSDSRRIPRICIHPNDPKVVYAAVLGHLYGPNQERGVFRSLDGGEKWEKVLFVNDEVGAFDLIIDPANPRVLYASTWRIKRTPYSLESGGEGCGLWKSIDGGDTWKEITRNRGLPKDTVGVIGVTVSPVDSQRVWAIIESKNGGVFRSDNGGESWSKINSDRNLRQRAWYYTRIYAGPKSRDEVYVLNVSFWRSIDGGKTFGSIRTPHGDHHDLWIAPEDPKRMIVADDGGGQVTFNGGRTWSTYQNQPTAQFYRVTTDNHFPYRIYGAQQDNSTVRLKHRTDGRSIGERDWEPTAGGESGHIAPDPDNPEIVFGGSYGGYLTRFDHRSGQVRNVHIWPDNPMGHGAGDGKYRFQWNFPIFFSPHKKPKKTLYAAGNVLFKSHDEGQSWTQISPDLTRNDKSKLGSSGGPITKDNTSVEYYCTIFAAAESQHEPGVIWTGSDDGLLHLTRDGGEKWDNVTPPELPEWSQINSIEVHPHVKGGLYVAATRYKLDDFKPYLFKTLDYGKTWKRIDNGIPRKHFTRVVRADYVRKGCLYAGTESGLYISLDDGENWKPFQLNLPLVPVTDLAIKEDDLIVATQGRSFWILDHLNLIHQLDEAALKSKLHLFDIDDTIRMRGSGSSRRSLQSGQNLPGGTTIFFNLAQSLENDEKLKLTIADSQGQTIQEFSSKPGKKQQKLSVETGLNTFRWNLAYPDAKTFPGMILWGGGTRGPRAIPGDYTATFTLEKQAESSKPNSKSLGGASVAELKKSFKILPDPRSSATAEDYKAQFDFLISVRDKLSQTHTAIRKIREARTQIESLKKRVGKNEKFVEVVKAANDLLGKLKTIEEALYQTKNQSPQDPLNFPIRLNNRLSSLASVVATGDFRPTAQAIAVKADLSKKIDTQLTEFNAIFDSKIKALNQLVIQKQVPAVVVED